MTDLYRYLSADGRLLYVGVSLNAALRAGAHRLRPWWHEVATITVEHYDDRGAALDAERRAILTERPAYNVTHNADKIGTTPERARALAAERAKRYRDRRRGHEHAMSDDPRARAKRKMRRGAKIGDLDPEEQEAVRAYNREYQRARRRDVTGT